MDPVLYHLGNTPDGFALVICPRDYWEENHHACDNLTQEVIDLVDSISPSQNISWTTHGS